MKGKPVDQRQRLSEPAPLQDNGVGKDLDPKDPDFLKKLCKETGATFERR